MRHKKESWLDPVKDKDIEEYLRKRYSHEIHGNVINNLHYYDFKFVFENGKKAKVNFDLQIDDDWDRDDLYPVFDEFGDIDTKVDNLFNENFWVEMIRELNKDRVIDGKTYDQARLDHIEKQIIYHFNAEQRKLNERKILMLQKVDKVRKELKTEELGEE